MTNVTVHNFSKSEKPISVDNRNFGKALKRGGLWVIFDKNMKEIGSVDSVRGIEFFVMKVVNG